MNEADTWRLLEGKVKVKSLLKLIRLVYLAETQEMSPKVIAEALKVSERQAYGYWHSIRLIDAFYRQKQAGINQEALNY